MRWILQMLAAVLPVPLIPALYAAQCLPSRNLIPLTTVPSQYIPTAGAEVPERVSVERTAFEVDERTNRARIEIDYTYPDRANFGADGGRGPQPSFVAVSGLTYEAAANAVILHRGTQAVTCAMRLAKSRHFQSSGHCMVIAKLEPSVPVHGSGIGRSLNTYLEVK